MSRSKERPRKKGIFTKWGEAGDKLKKGVFGTPNVKVKT